MWSKIRGKSDKPEEEAGEAAQPIANPESKDVKVEESVPANVEQLDAGPAKNEANPN